jgi:NAD(P)-dependent dehydrogenase (short-subunit alcohol dehydrogenase family)
MSGTSMSQASPESRSHADGECLLRGKVIIVTGASSGIGADAARVFTREGAAVLLSARSADRMAALCREWQSGGATASFVAGDISDASQVQALVSAVLERHQRLDGAFNNAGMSQGGGLLADITEERFDELLAVNLKSVWLCLRAQIRAILSSGGPGAIVNTSSVGGVRGDLGISAYMATKHGVIGLTRGAAHDYGDRGIRVNAIAPGTTDTAMIAAWKRREPGIEDRLNALTPMRRAAQPPEVAEAAAWLLSDRASYINGAVLPVDGGMTC